MSASLTTVPEDFYVSLGSNLGNRREYLLHAVDAVEQTLGITVQCSSLYETKPVGYTYQPDFLNLVIKGVTRLKPFPLLQELNAIEQRLGRKRNIRFGPRTIDLDILLYGNRYECFRCLQIPHPRMWQRTFVMVPLAELAPLRRGLGGEAMADIASRIAKEGDLFHAGYLR